jgi:anti-anti-sigma factor
MVEYSEVGALRIREHKMGRQPPVILKEFPDCRNQGACRAFLRDMEALLFHSYRPRIIFDLSHVDHMNAAGIDLLLKCVVEIADRDGYLKLAAPSAQAALVLELTQLNGVVEIFDTVEGAMESFGVYHLPEPHRPESLPQNP